MQKLSLYHVFGPRFPTFLSPDLNVRLLGFFQECHPSQMRFSIIAQSSIRGS